MTRLKQVLTAAAALIVGGLGVTVALQQAALDMHPNYTRTEWNLDTSKHRDEQTWATFFLAIPNDVEIPKAWPATPDGVVLGDCLNGQCCIDGLCYRYNRGPLVNGYRLHEIYAPPYFANGWRKWALDTPTVKWMWSFGQVVDLCRASPEFTDVQCLNLLEGDKRCWRLNTGGCCRYGLRGCEPTASGLNGEACPYALVTGPMPCVTNRGAGSAMADAVREWTVEEMD